MNNNTKFDLDTNNKSRHACDTIENDMESDRKRCKLTPTITQNECQQSSSDPCMHNKLLTPSVSLVYTIFTKVTNDINTTNITPNTETNPNINDGSSTVIDEDTSQSDQSTLGSCHQFTVATLNLSSVASPVEFHCAIDHPDYEQMLADYKTLLLHKTCTVLTYIGEEILMKIVHWVGSMIPSVSNIEEDDDDDNININNDATKVEDMMVYWFAPLVETKTPHEFFSDTFLEKTRILSLRDRYDVDRNAVLRRGHVSGSPKIETYVDELLEHATQTFHVIKPITHEKYPDFPVKWQGICSKMMQVAAGVVFDVLQYKLLKETGFDMEAIGAQLYNATITSKNDQLYRIITEYGVDVWCVQEASQPFLHSLNDSYAIYHHPNMSPQITALLVSNTLFKNWKVKVIDDTDGDTCNDNVCHGDDHSIVLQLIKKDDETCSICIGGFHCKSDGSETIERVGCIIENKHFKSQDNNAIIMGDCNLTRHGTELGPRRQVLDDLLLEHQYTTTAPENTTRRLRTILGVQWSKISHDGIAYEEPKDLIAVKGGTLSCVSYDNCGNGVPDPAVNCPNVKLPTDHFIVSTRVTFTND